MGLCYSSSKHVDKPSVNQVNQYQHQQQPIVNQPPVSKINPQLPPNQKKYQYQSKSNTPSCYDILNSIPEFHKPKKYKTPPQMVEVQPQSANMYFYPQDYVPVQYDINPNLYQGCDFSYKHYIASIPKKKDDSTTYIDESKALFFRVGHSPVYSESIFAFIGFQGNETVWVDIDDPSYKITRKITIPEEIEAILIDDSIRKAVMQCGWIIINGHKWGFLLNLQSIEEAYHGYLPIRWQILLQLDYFKNMVEKFGMYFEELNAGNNNTGVVPKDIPSTDFDPFLPDWYVTFNNMLFWRQRQEVGWMYRLENYPGIKFHKKVHSSPFLDTGYYLNPTNTGFLPVESVDDFVDVMMPGGILASQIGSGKTVTSIALTTIGSQFKYGVNLGHQVVPLNNQDPTVVEMNNELDGVYEPSLIIVTKNILGQWREEFQKFAPHLQVCVLENENDILNYLKVGLVKGSEYRLKHYDVVLTHRKVIEQGDLIAKHCPDFFKVTFRRVMIDEFHELTMMMKDQFRIGAKVVDKDIGESIEMYNFCLNLKKIDRRFTWGITGTPDDLDYYNDTTPLFKLLNLDESYNKLNTFSKLKDKYVMTCMRKNPRGVDLPPLKKAIEKVYFGQLQNLLYQGKLNYAKNKNAAQEICSHLLPQWRQLENTQDPIQKVIEAVHKKHQDEIEEVQKKLLKDKKNESLQGRLEVLLSEGNFFTDVIKVISQEMFDCPICLTEQLAVNLVVTECMHNVCITCYKGLKKAVDIPQCPVCRETIQNNSLLIHPNFREKKETKLTAIIKAIQATPWEDKIIIFTQFHSLLEHLTETFNQIGVPFIVLRGQPSEINISLNRFRYVPDIKVLLMSIEQAASGVNVTMANHVFFAHPIFGMEFQKAALTYNQCIGRAYRIGQFKQVNVKLFVTVGSIEEDMVPAFNKFTDTLN